MADSTSLSILRQTPLTSNIATKEWTEDNFLPLSAQVRQAWYGECGTAQATKAKTVEIPGITELQTGLQLRIKFTAAQRASSPTLDINDLGAYPIRRNGTTAVANYEWLAGEVIDFVFDGTAWIVSDGGIATTSYYGYTKLYSGATATSTSYALAPAALNSYSENTVVGAPALLTSSTYSVGDRVRYQFNTYECISDVQTPGAWASISSHFKELDPIQIQIDNLSDAVANIDIPEVDGKFVHLSGDTVSADFALKIAGSNVLSGLNENVTIGKNSKTGDYSSTAIGKSSTATAYQATAIGASASVTKAGSLAVGASANANGVGSTVVGIAASASDSYSVSLGYSAKATAQSTIAIGRKAEATAANAIQIGTIDENAITNNVSNTLQIWDKPLLKRTDGKIFVERIPDLPISSVTDLQTTLNNKLSGVKMNGSNVTVTNGVADLSTVLTAHQSLSDLYILSGEVVEGLSNVVIPKLDTISGLVEDEVEKVDEISAKFDDYSLTGHTHTSSDITNFPPIPTVNNGTLTIQRNGQTIQTFSADQSTSVSANITVPTKTSDLTNDSNFLTAHQSLSALSKYLPLSGGTLTGDLTIEKANPVLTLQDNDTVRTPYVKINGLNQQIIVGNDSLTATLALPKTSGTLALSSQIPTKTSDLTNDSGYVVSSDLTKVMEYQGSVETYENLPVNAEKGDVYNVISAHGDYPPGTNYAKGENGWDPLGGSIDVSNFATKSQLTNYLPLSGGSMSGALSANNGFRAEGYQGSTGLSIGNGENDDYYTHLVANVIKTSSTGGGVVFENGYGYGLSVDAGWTSDFYGAYLNATKVKSDELFINADMYGGGLSVGQGTDDIYGTYIDATNLTAPGMIAGINSTAPHGGLSVTGIDFGDGSYLSSANGFALVSALNKLSSEVTYGLSNVVNPKLSVIANSVEEEVAKLDELSGKLSGYAYKDHTHSISAITNLQTTLDSKVSAITVNGSKKTPTNGTIDLGAVAGTLNTTLTASQPTNASESLSGNINLHKISKTGSWSDLLDKPFIPLSTSQLSNDKGFITSADVSSINIDSVYYDTRQTSTITVIDGYTKGASLGFVSDYNGSLTSTVSYSGYGSDALACPLACISSYGGYTAQELEETLYNYCGSYGYNGDGVEAIYGYGHVYNTMGEKNVESIYGDYSGTTVYAHYGAQYGADMVEWQDSGGTAYDGTGVTILPAKIVTINSSNTKVYREPRVYYYRSSGSNVSFASFTLFKDYVAIETSHQETITTGFISAYNDYVSATYATKDQIAGALTGYVDLTSDNQSVSGSKIFNNLSASFIDSFNGFRSGASSAVARNITVGPEAIDIRHDGKRFSLEAAGTGAQIHVINESNNYTDTWKFHSPSAAQTNYFVASEEYVKSNFISSETDPVFNDWLSGTSVKIGRNSSNTNSTSDSSAIAIGQNAAVNGNVGIAIGYAAKTNDGFALGLSANATAPNDDIAGIAIGYNTYAYGNIYAEKYGIAIGDSTSATTDDTVALGDKAMANNLSSIQLGRGTNNTQKSLQVWEYQLLDSNGNVPEARISSITSKYLPLSSDDPNGQIELYNTALSSNAFAIINHSLMKCLELGYDTKAVPFKSKRPPYGQTIIGISSFAGDYGTTLGHATSAAYSATAIGYGATANVSGSIQLGQGINNEVSSLQVYNWQLLDSSGNIPYARLSSNIKYRIVTPTQTTSGTSVSATMEDNAINHVSLASTVTTATISFPPKVTGYARDFFVRLTITGSTVPAITWQEADGSAIDFDVDDDSWSEIEQGVNILMFTETAQ